MEESKKDIIIELKEVAPFVANVSKVNPYSVPEGYFDSLAESFLFHVRLLQLKDSGSAFSVPEGYFENLPHFILNKIREGQNEVQEELAEVAPVLNTINKENIFSIPDNYFEKLTIPLPKERKTGKIISLAGSVRKWVTYAAAASVLFIIATTSYLYVSMHHKTIEKHLPIEQRIAELNEEELINYLKDNDGIISGNLIPATNEDPQIQNMLQRVSDEEIENYLNEYGDQNEKPIKGI